MVNLPDRKPAVAFCRCCNKILELRWQPGHNGKPGSFLVTCTTPGCNLNGVTATDICYTETTDNWIK